jgi:glutaredoxin
MRVTFITRHDCHLCEEMAGVIAAVRAQIDFELEVLDVDGAAALRARYSDQVPVLLIDGRRAFKYRVSAPALARRLRLATWRRRLHL